MILFKVLLIKLLFFGVLYSLVIFMYLFSEMLIGILGKFRILVKVICIMIIFMKVIWFKF